MDDKHQVIIHAEAMGNGQDHDNLKPMVDGAKENLKVIGKGDEPLKNIILSADANYHNNSNIAQCEDKNIDAYIPDPNFRKRDERFKDQERFKDGINMPKKMQRKRKSPVFGAKDFCYDKERDVYICPKKALLTLETRHQVMRKKVYRVYRIKNGSCDECHLRKKCLYNSKSRQRYLCIPQEVEKDDPASLTPSQRKIDTDVGKEIYSARLGNIEPVFANIRSNKRLDRFTYRTKEKVNVQ